MRYLMMGLLGLVTLAVSSDASPDGPERAVIESQPAPGCMGQRWVSYEVDEPVTLTRRVKKWRLESYPIAIPDPGPQPADVVISEPVYSSQAPCDCQTVQATVNCPPCEVLQTVQPQVGYQTIPQEIPPIEGGLIQSQNLAPSNVQVGVFRNQNQNCPDGQCTPNETRQRGGILRRILGR